MITDKDIIISEFLRRLQTKEVRQPQSVLVGMGLGGKEGEEKFLEEMLNKQYCEREDQYIKIASRGVIKHKALQNELEERETKLKTAISPFINYLDMAEQFLQIQPLYYAEEKMFWIWNFIDKNWEMIDEIDLMNKLEPLLPPGSITTNSKIKSEILEALKRKGREKKPEACKKSWISFNGTIVDITTGKTFESTPKYFTINNIPWKFGESEDTPILDALFKEWVDPSDIPLLYEIIAYSLLPDIPIHRIFCFNGGGRNGKGTFQDILIKMSGENNHMSSSLKRLTQNRFETSGLYRKLLCTTGETNFNAIADSEVLKSMSGGDKIYYEFKGKSSFTDDCYATLVIATNSLPVTLDKTDGFYSRWIIVSFPNQFDEKQRIILGDSEEQPHATIVPDLEFENLARKSVRILKDLLIKREFTNQGTINDRKKRYEEISNPIGLFLVKYCDEDYDGFIIYNNFRDKFHDFCAKHKYRKLSVNEIGSRLINEGFSRRQRKVEGFEDKLPVICGLSWKNPDMSLENGKNTKNGSSHSTLPYRDEMEIPNPDNLVVPKGDKSKKNKQKDILEFENIDKKDDCSPENEDKIEEEWVVDDDETVSSVTGVADHATTNEILQEILVYLSSEGGKIRTELLLENLSMTVEKEDIEKAIVKLKNKGDIYELPEGFLNLA